MHEIITSGFLFPNEIEVHWSIMIVLYPYITGLVAGAFIVSSLYHVFGVKELKPIAKFSLVGAFCFLIFACTPLLFHLGHPERAFNVMFTPKFSSAMSGFGYIYSFYMIIVLFEVWFVFRPEIIKRAKQYSGYKKIFYWILSLGTYDLSDETLAVDHKATTLLAVVGIPSACILHGYVGFLFGSLKSNPWWSTPLMPVIFLMSAIVSGISVLILCYWIASKLGAVKLDNSCMKSLYKYLWGFFIIDLTLELLEVLTMFYESHEEWAIISRLLTEKLMGSYVIFQLLLCSAVPMIALGIICLKELKDTTRNLLGLSASALILLQVLAMRWNVIIGGQLFSKSFRGLTTYNMEFLGREGFLVALILLILPFVTIYVFNLILPLWQDETETVK
jgi:Ni/Fe-hydrogenase subunit HybB-like protein